MAEEIQQDIVERGARVGVPGGTKVIRPGWTIETPLSESETAVFENLLGKPGAHGVAQALPGAEKSALVVEDDPQARRLIVSVLAKIKVKPLEVADGGNALKALVKYKVDLVVLDMRLPVLDGFRVLRGARGYLKVLDTPIVVVTALSDVKDEQAALDMGADVFLRKPFDLHSLRANFQAALRRGALLSAP